MTREGHDTPPPLPHLNLGPSPYPAPLDPGYASAPLPTGSGLGKGIILGWLPSSWVLRRTLQECSQGAFRLSSANCRVFTDSSYTCINEYIQNITMSTERGGEAASSSGVGGSEGGQVGRTIVPAWDVVVHLDKVVKSNTPLHDPLLTGSDVAGEGGWLAGGLLEQGKQGNNTCPRLYRLMQANARAAVSRVRAVAATGTPHSCRCQMVARSSLQLSPSGT